MCGCRSGYELKMLLMESRRLHSQVTLCQVETKSSFYSGTLAVKEGSRGFDSLLTKSHAVLSQLFYDETSCRYELAICYGYGAQYRWCISNTMQTTKLKA